jgi:Heparinase II/III-like protein
MKKLIYTLLLCVAIHNLFAQVTQRNIMSKKYTSEAIKQALIPKNQWKPYPKTAAEWRAALPDTVLKNIITNGEAALNYTFEPISGTISMDFARSGDRLRHGGISYTKRNTLMELILAESVEDKGRFTEAIFNGIWSICEESYWGVPAHIRSTSLPDVDNPVVDLFAAETAAVMGVADYLVGEKLDKINPLIRKRMYSETNKRIFTPMTTDSVFNKYGWMSKTNAVNNWNPWIMSNWIMSSLLLEKDEKRRGDMLYGAMRGLDLYLNGLGEDGGCDEGPSYWFAAGGSVYDCLELLSKATKDKVNIYDVPLIQKMASYVYKAHIDGYYFTNFADADPTLRPDGLMLYRFGKAINDAKMVQFGQWAYQNFPNTAVTGYQRMRRLENILTAKNIEKGDKYEPVKEAWVSDIQVMAARTNKGLYLAAHGGHNAESHNHNDVGDFIIYADGQPMIVDAGRGNYTARTFSSNRYDLWFTQSEHHNLPIVNGIGQKVGREFEAKNVKSQINDAAARLEMDIAPAYPKEAGITDWKRTIVLNRTKNQVELSDTYNLTAKPTSLKHVFMTICDIDDSKQGKISLKGAKNTELILNYDPSQWAVTMEEPSTEGMEYSSFKTKWAGRKVVRIVLTSKVLNQKGQYAFTFEKK